jgi:hypothetical protein
VAAHSTDHELPIRPIVLTDSGDHERVLAMAEQTVTSDAVLWRSRATHG